MRVEFRPCKVEHLACIRVQDAQAGERAIMLDPEYGKLIEANLSLSAWAGNTCIGAAGILPLYPPHRSIAWALLSKDVRAYMVPLVLKMRTVLQLDQTPRIEMTVNADFTEGHRLALLVGMERETGVLRGYGPGGEDQVMYVRLR